MSKFADQIEGVLEVGGTGWWEQETAQKVSPYLDLNSDSQVAIERETAGQKYLADVYFPLGVHPDQDSVEVVR